MASISSIDRLSVITSIGIGVLFISLFLLSFSALLQGLACFWAPDEIV